MIILVRYGEIHLKGLNRPYFENLLVKNMKNALKRFDGIKVTRGQGRFYVTDFAESDAPSVMDVLTKVFGIHSISPAYECEKDLDSICKAMKDLLSDYMAKYGIKETTFKVESKRSDKRFPMNSMQLSAEIGGYLLENIEGLTVDVHSPKTVVYAEIREKAYIYVDKIPGQGGMPVHSCGKALLMLSGGIDSPVAGYMVAKRGVKIDAIHYHSAPYTSEAAKQKVCDLAKLLTPYTGKIRLHVVPFTEIQMEIYRRCPHEDLVIIMRRFMMRIAQRVARRTHSLAIATGESIGQVASQTLESMGVTGAVVDMPVIRPLIGMDKIEIINIAERIGTYETSILPYEDCCTVFVPKHPVIKPKRADIEKAEEVLDIEALVSKAVENIEIIDINC